MFSRFRFISQSVRYVTSRITRLGWVCAGRQLTAWYRERKRHAEDRRILMEMSEIELRDLAMGRSEILQQTGCASADQRSDDARSR